MFTCYRGSNVSNAVVLASPYCHFWKWLFLLLSITLIGVTANLQLVPHFTFVPPLVTPFIGIPTNLSTNQHHASVLPPLVDLVCRAWPPNARISLVTSPLLSAAEATTLSPLTNQGEVGAGDPVRLHYGILEHQQPRSRQTELDNRQPPSDRYFDTHLEAIRHRPGCMPTDEVAVRLTISDTSLTMSSPEALRTSLDRLEQMRLFCVVETPLGGLVSRPFRIRSTSLGEFPPSRPGLSQDSPLQALSPAVETATTTTLKILHNNLGVIDCHLPVNAYPEPVVQVELNGSLIDVHSARNSQKYRLVNRPGNRRVSLLIRQLQTQDAGLYRCFFVNPLTGERKASPEPVFNLQIIRPTTPVVPTVFIPLASGIAGARSSSSSSEMADGVEQARAQVITVDEGQNVTLFCVIHAAPPPTVSTYPFQLNSTGHRRFHRDDMFGLLHITNVQPADAGFYICSERQISSTAQLRVRSRLQLVTTPQDTRIAQLGGTVEFNCATSDPDVTPDWLVNGRPAGGSEHSVGRSAGSTKLTIPSVGQRDLGFYQCVAWKPLHTGEKHDEEWVNATAMLTLATDELLVTSDNLRPYLPKTEIPNTLLTPQDLSGAAEAPVAETIFDNLAVLLTWQSVDSTTLSLVEDGLQEDKQTQEKRDNSVVQYRLEYSVQQTAVEVATARENSSTGGKEHQGQTNSPSGLGGRSYSPVEMAIALMGLVGFEAIRWSEPRPLGQSVSTPYIFVASPPLEPGKRYRFRVLPPDPVASGGGGGLQRGQPPSKWSSTVSMEHISAATPPEIQLVRHLSDGQVHVIWRFGDQPAPAPELPQVGPAGESQQQQKAIPTTVVGSGGWPVGEPFQVDYFNVLARPVIKPKRGALDPVEYGAYVATRVNGSRTRESFLAGLNRSLDYQVIVYAVRGAGGSRQITRFSKPVFVNSLPTDLGGRYSLLASLANNRVLYMVLGGIAALMIFVVFILVLLCMCRQLRDNPRRMMAAERKKQNGYLRGNSTSGGGHKNTLDDPGMMVHPPTTTDGSNPAACALPVTCQSDYYHHHQQAQMRQSLAVNPYSPLPDGKEPLLSGSAAQQQHQQMMGSQFHLSYYHQPTTTATTGLQAVAPPHHHQSHHSLLLSPSAALSTAGRVFQTGTLPMPGGSQQQQQRYYRSAHQPPAGSVLVYNGGGRAITPGPMLEMAEYAGAGYQQQPQQVYAANHQQQQQLPSQQQSIAHQMGVYYQNGYPNGHPHPGLMTPGAMSLKREGGGGGSLREHGSTYGTLLQRGAGGNHLTGSFISDQQQHAHQMSGTPQSSGGVAMATYYHPSTLQHHPPPYVQAFHHHQQQQFPGGYYGQQAPSDIMFVGTPGSQQHHLLQQHQQQPSYRATDGESVYSYFSQNEASGNPPGVGIGHQYLNALPEESNPQMLGGGTGITGYVDSGMQTGGELNNIGLQPTVDNNGDSPTTAGGAAGGHRHHRRRKRKQQQQPTRHTSDSVGADGDQDSSQLVMQMQQQQQSDDQLSQPAGVGNGGGQPDENQLMNASELSEEVKRKLSLTTTTTNNIGAYSDAEQTAAGFTYPQPPSYHHQQQLNSGGAGLSNCRFDSSSKQQRSATPGGGCALPPPNQPPPPPPPNAAAMACSDSLSGDFSNGVGGFYPSGDQQQMYSPMAAVNPGFMEYRRGCYSTTTAGATAGGLLVGPPPRVRDYSEYGIPRGIGLPPTPDGAAAASNSPPQRQLHFLKAVGNSSNGMMSSPHHQHPLVNGVVYPPAAAGLYGSGGATSGYREGQA